jgi:quercetin dioxygenase-like cupin family protein
MQLASITAPMTWNKRHLVSTLALALVASMNVQATGLEQPERQTAFQGQQRLVAESRFAVTDAPNQAELIQLVVDFEPGAWTSLHTHGGQAINLVLEGEITLRHGGMDRPYRAGESWSDSTGQIHAAGNTGSGNARLLTNFLLPKGAPQITVIQETAFGPAVSYEARFALPPLPREAEIVQRVIDLSPGWRAQHAYNGFVATTVVDREVTYRIGPQHKTYKPGESWSARTGVLIEEDTPTQARVFSSYIVQRGAHPVQ